MSFARLKSLGPANDVIAMVRHRVYIKEIFIAHVATRIAPLSVANFSSGLALVLALSLTRVKARRNGQAATGE